MAPTKWLSRKELADRWGIPVATLAQWGSQSKGPRYATFGRHCRYRLADVTSWEAEQFGDQPNDDGRTQPDEQPGDQANPAPANRRAASA